MHKKMMKLGHALGCHQLPERSFAIRGYQFPVCARCTGLIVGYLLAITMFSLIKLPTMVSIVFCWIMFMDWFLQYLTLLNSTNVRRLLTGLLCGYGIMNLVLQGFLKIMALF